MKMSVPTKTPITLSNLVVEGLGHLGTTIPLDTTKKIIANSVKLTLHPEATIPPVPEIYATNSGKAKQSEYAIVTLYSLAIKHNLDVMAVRQVMEERHLNPAVIEELTRTYEEQRKHLFLRQLQVSHSFPHITDLQWRIVADVKSSTSDHSSKEVGFHINLGRYKQKGGERETIVEFVCNTEELQLLINKLKEIERHCCKETLE
ncbi:COMM domain-containing protein 3 [Calliphora vicina]|uniref:COMM domain-containing protein 3 n=1 Tax=Calliphora vicina TaxID=7373 RepID=UPI00325ADD86